LLVHQVVRHLHHYLLDQPTVQSLQTPACLLDVHELLQTLLVGFLDGVVEYFRIRLVFCEQFIILFDLLGVQGAFGFGDVQEDLLDFKIVLLNRWGGTKERLI